MFHRRCQISANIKVFKLFEIHWASSCCSRCIVLNSNQTFCLQMAFDVKKMKYYNVFVRAISQLFRKPWRCSHDPRTKCYVCARHLCHNCDVIVYLPMDLEIFIDTTSKSWTGAEAAIMNVFSTLFFPCNSCIERRGFWLFFFGEQRSSTLNSPWRMATSGRIGHFSSHFALCTARRRSSRLMGWCTSTVERAATLLWKVTCHISRRVFWLMMS